MKALLIGPENPHFVAHLRTLQVLDEITDIALAASVPEEFDLLPNAAQIQPAKIAARHATLTTDVLKETDVVIACPRNDRAVKIITAALQAGKPVLAEKPCGRNAKETKQIVDAAATNQQTLGVFYVNRLHPAVQLARQFVQDGLLGDLMHVEMRWFTTQPRFRDPSHWLFDRQRAGGGIVQWLGCHMLDLATYITGEACVSAQAQLAQRSGAAISVEDVAALSLRFASGGIGSLNCGYVLAQSGSGYENRAGNDSYMCITGTHGRVRWSQTKTPCEVEMESTRWQTDSQRVVAANPETSNAYGGKHGEAFVRAFLRGQPVSTGHDALAVAQLLDQIYL